MQVLLSPAKTMTGKTALITPVSTSPRFEKEAGNLMREMAKIPVEELKRMLKLSPKLALESLERIHRFFSDEQTAIPALLAYTGVVFKHISPQDFTAEDFEFAQKHLRIVSVAYGLLRPLDCIKPYRLEYDVRLPDLTDSSLYPFWRERQTETLLADIRSDDGVLLNLASKDVQPAFDWKEICSQVKVVTPEFMVNKDGKLKTVVIYAKMLRGEMSRFLIKNRITDPEMLKAFEWEGFHFQPSLSDERKWVFTA